jgi:hypothetical protein
MRVHPVAASTIRYAIAGVVLAVSCAMIGCSSDPPPPPELTSAAAATQLLDRWSKEELNHFTVVFHSDTLIECGVRNELWKLVEMTDKTGYAWSTVYQLTDKGRKEMTAIDLKESGRGHQITLRGPYRYAILSIADVGLPNNRRVGFYWELDWDKASPELKACLPKFELAGKQMANFELVNPQTENQSWRLAGYLTPEEAATAPAGTNVMDQLKGR